ncbi:hypothetical protein JK211_14435 [Tatumella sp. JGM130]|uniref:hypothetical protein n=1 Tax=Tatumella sp. JGM130 TaxID=2799797 RepID=UPI001BAFF233|nr:hypothetical protein [Tatumella sp. JGM130]MBS0895212.1 hypothetical protein [Tatumella sp. JGM130]
MDKRMNNFLMTLSILSFSAMIGINILKGKPEISQNTIILPLLPYIIFLFYMISPKISKAIIDYKVYKIVKSNKYSEQFKIEYLKQKIKEKKGSEEYE